MLNSFRNRIFSPNKCLKVRLSNLRFQNYCSSVDSTISEKISKEMEQEDIIQMYKSKKKNYFENTSFVFTLHKRRFPYTDQIPADEIISKNKIYEIIKEKALFYGSGIQNSDFNVQATKVIEEDKNLNIVELLLILNFLSSRHIIKHEQYMASLFSILEKRFSEVMTNPYSIALFLEFYYKLIHLNQETITRERSLFFETDKQEIIEKKFNIRYKINFLPNNLATHCSRIFKELYMKANLTEENGKSFLCLARCLLRLKSKSGYLHGIIDQCIVKYYKYLTFSDKISLILFYSTNRFFFPLYTEKIFTESYNEIQKFIAENPNSVVDASRCISKGHFYDILSYLKPKLFPGQIYDHIKIENLIDLLWIFTNHNVMEKKDYCLMLDNLIMPTTSDLPMKELLNYYVAKSMMLGMGFIEPKELNDLVMRMDMQAEVQTASRIYKNILGSSFQLLLNYLLKAYPEEKQKYMPKIDYYKSPIQDFYIYNYLMTVQPPKICQNFYLKSLRLWDMYNTGNLYQMGKYIKLLTDQSEELFLEYSKENNVQIHYETNCKIVLFLVNVMIRPNIVIDFITHINDNRYPSRMSDLNGKYQTKKEILKEYGFKYYWISFNEYKPFIENQKGGKEYLKKFFNKIIEENKKEIFPN